MFFTNVFSYANRHRVFRHAYQSTIRDIRARRKELAPKLARHGIAIRAAALRGDAAPAPHHARTSFLTLAGALDRLERWVGRAGRRTAKRRQLQ